jgi:hypothetical protein
LPSFALAIVTLPSRVFVFKPMLELMSFSYHLAQKNNAFRLTLPRPVLGEAGSVVIFAP